ncbi:tRNA-dihydrouridine(16/17) synthase [NAD(P)(+)]-like [Plutella xylostella]|uniref:tRNA-dihydrouridine(16/17) synthase [NAD(P)(+)]-like n=1 Tax=Plutella xylostella TaxID=51655 RepID=UPI002032DC4E|nr:tRNA-dihydrouridine(16/17) synthase [NAD(P)(+)]-like [Plutella xylostella]
MSHDWFERIGKPKYVVAPMVDASELAWRILCRRHGAQLCYTPMFHSNVFVKDPKYRKESFTTCPEDRPLIVQFCGNNPDTMAAAAKLVEEHCDAIDINLGCPQAIAKRGRYGSFLQDDWELLNSIVQAMSKAVSIPITCKVRIFDDIDKTVEYARMLERAGCRLLTVHGRTREQKGPLTGVARWKHIKAVREAVSIPVFANGNIQCLADVARCLAATGAAGVMSAEGNLTNPAIFEGASPVTWDVADEYLDLVQQYPCPTSYIRGHLFKIFHKIFTFEDNDEIRQILATGQNLNDFRKVSSAIKQKYLSWHQGGGGAAAAGGAGGEGALRAGTALLLPPWLCQPYVRMSPEEHTRKMQALNIIQDSESQCKRILEDPEGNVISRKKMKKLQRTSRRPARGAPRAPRPADTCLPPCANPRGGKCEYKLCKKCCKSKCFVEERDCRGHGVLVATRRRAAQHHAALRAARGDPSEAQHHTTLLAQRDGDLREAQGDAAVEAYTL